MYLFLFISTVITTLDLIVDVQLLFNIEVEYNE
jgi:hypothetical protein